MGIPVKHGMMVRGGLLKTLNTGKGVEIVRESGFVSVINTFSWDMHRLTGARYVGVGA